jgi:hypothetical protein
MEATVNCVKAIVEPVNVSVGNVTVAMSVGDGIKTPQVMKALPNEPVPVNTFRACPVPLTYGARVEFVKLGTPPPSNVVKLVVALKRSVIM